MLTHTDDEARETAAWTASLTDDEELAFIAALEELEHLFNGLATQ